MMSNILQIIFSDILDEILLGFCFEIHRASKLGFLFIDETSVEEEKKYAIIDEKGVDIFGHSNTSIKKQYECICPSCQRTLAAQRFAPHLEKCMGMGRNSSRIASKRIASSTGKINDSDGDDCDNSGDTDWNYNQDNKRSKKKKEKNGSTLGTNFVKKLNKINSRNLPSTSNCDNNSNPSNQQGNEYFNENSNEPMFSSLCRMISENKQQKICTRNLRCPQRKKKNS